MADINLTPNTNRFNILHFAFKDSSPIPFRDRIDGISKTDSISKLNFKTLIDLIYFSVQREFSNKPK